MSSTARELASMLVEAKRMGSGADLTSLVAPASMQLPISGIEVGALGVAFAAPHLMRAPLEPTPERRMLQLMTAKLNSYARALPPWGKKPFNPTLGELLVAQEPGSSSSPQWKVIAEQVSHHPPVTVTALESAHASTLDELQARPIFQGNTVEVAMTGPPERVVLRLPAQAAGGAEVEEVYEVLSRPSLCIRGILGLGRQFTEWAGTHEIVCARSGLRGVIEYGAAGLLGRVGAPPHQVVGELRDVATGAVVATVRGGLDSGVVAELASPPPADSGGGPAAGAQQGVVVVLLEPGSMTPLEALPADAAAAYEAPRHSLFWPKQTSSVWCRLSAALVAQRWADAREAKRAVEQAGRAARAAREQSGRPWRPQLFAFDGGAGAAGAAAAAAAAGGAAAGGGGVAAGQAGRWRPTAEAFAEAWEAESPLSRRLLKSEGAADGEGRDGGGGGGGGAPGVLVPFVPRTPVAETTLIL